MRSEVGALVSLSNAASLAGRRPDGVAPKLVRWPDGAGEPAAIAAALLRSATGATARDPLFAFTAYLAHLAANGEHLVVVIDDLATVEGSAARWLRGAVEHSGGALRVVASARDHRAAALAAARLGVPLRVAHQLPASPARRAWRPVWLAVAGAVVLALGALVAR